VHVIQADPSGPPAPIGRSIESWPHHQKINKTKQVRRRCMAEAGPRRAERKGGSVRVPTDRVGPFVALRSEMFPAAAAVRPGAPACCSLPETDSPPRFASRPLRRRREGTNLRNIDGAGSADGVSFPRMQSRSHSFFLMLLPFIVGAVFIERFKRNIKLNAKSIYCVGTALF
jgi:hypothetical protein